MKSYIFTGFFPLATVLLLAGCKTHSQPPETAKPAAPAVANSTNLLSDKEARVSYAIGMMAGKNWKQQDVAVDYNFLVQGMKAGEGEGTALLTEQEMRETLSQFQKDLYAAQQKKREELATKNKKAGDEFLAANKTKPGVVTLPDGLQYKVIADGNGESPAPEDTVTVNYRGTLIDGAEFDSSAKRGHPAQFRVNGVIHGWSEALTHMKTGAKWQLFVPPDLGYGEYGHPPQIEPNSVLIFDVELVSVEHAKPITSDIIKVPSADDMKKGAKIEVIKPQDAEKLQGTNSAK